MTQNSPPNTNGRAGLMRFAELIVLGCIRFAWALSRELYLHPQPLKGEYWGRFVRVIVSNKKSSPLDCFFV